MTPSLLLTTFLRASQCVSQNFKAAIFTSFGALLLVQAARVANALWLRRSRSPYRHLRQPSRPSLLFGNLGEFHRADLGAVPLAWAREFGGVVPFGGLLGEECLCITDSAAIEHILVTRCYEYEKPAEVRARLGRTLGKGLVFSQGHEHKKQRRLMNPSWTPSIIREAVPSFVEAAHALCDTLSELLSSKDPGFDSRFGKEGCQRENEVSVVVDVTKLLGATALQIIGKSAFDYDFQVFSSTGNPLAAAFNTVASAAGNKVTLARLLVQRAVQWGLEHMPWLFGRISRVKAVQKTLNLMERECGIIFNERKTQSSIDGRSPKDFLSLLIKASRMEGDKGLDEDELMGQMTTMVMAGHETSATLLAWIIHALARYPASQNKLRAELLEARLDLLAEDRRVEVLGALPYLDVVIREGLRLEPPVAKMHRVRVATTIDRVPLSHPMVGKNGLKVYSVDLFPGTEVYISVKAYNCDERIFGQDATSFVPERWLRTGVDRVEGEIPGAFGGTLSFSVGPRVCIGWRFALLEAKVLLAALVSSFVFEERDEHGPEIERGSAVIMRPWVLGEEHLGNRMPLRVSPLLTT